MRRNSRASYQLLTSAFILTVGCVVGVVAVRIWEGMILEEAIDARKEVVRGFDVACSRARPDLDGCVEAAASRQGLGVLSLRILDASGIVIAGTPDAPKGERERSEAVRERLGSPEIFAWRAASGDGPAGLLVTSPLHPPGGAKETLAVHFDMSGVERKIRRAVLHVLGLVGTLALVNFLTVGWLVRRWMTPITEMSRKMDEVQRGNMAVAVPEDRADEIGDLARHFNAMLDAIRKARKQSLELARRQANIEKFAALGRLSSGVAHEINNPVGGILTAIAVLRDVEPGSERYEEYLDMMRSGLERIAAIVSQLLRFSRAPREERKAIDLNALVEEISVFARLQHRAARIHLVRRFGELPAVSGAADLLNQLFLNLIMNAFQEMPDGGILTITTRQEDGWVAVSFEDTGPGIPEENLERIFEPFFTTKEVGEGTGLGLSVALGIVEAHGGTIEAANRPEGGARFTVRLPVLPPEAEPAESAGAGSQG